MSAPEEADARATAGALADVARASGAPVEVLGPAPAPLARLRDRYRFQLLVKAPDGEAVQQAGRALADAAAAVRAPVRASVDPNPVNML